MVEVKSGYDELCTTIELMDGEAAKLPDPKAEGYYNLVWFNYTDYKNPSDDPHREIVRVTALEGSLLKLRRGEEGIVASTKNAPGRIYKLILSFTKAAYEELVNGRHGIITGNTFGNERGDDATDFQFLRESSTQVASGEASFIASGSNNTASGFCSFASGSGNTASGLGSHSEGRSNTSSGMSSHSEGYFTSASGLSSHAEGQSCQAPGSSSHAEGFQTISQGNYSHAEGTHTSALGPYSHTEGLGATARLKGEHAFASGYITDYGDAQLSRLSLCGFTQDGIPSEIFISPPSDRIVLEDNLAAGFCARITAHTSGNLADAAFFEIKGLITRGAGASSVQLFTCLKTVIHKASSSWDANFAADTVNGALILRVTGETAKTVRWVSVVEMYKIR
ncbi:MAG: hypothetical protein HF314_16485 [Ignavibacteria bacterium]|jgi:hypothetical protein|nr:hypothetical protein [Ignavibacteria bacterium]MCU7504681.1 hypothetical protein [Ignavibacteria bacterium]MCU7516283.1 hypothetical protein [Ignavibacteria bacterium]